MRGVESILLQSSGQRPEISSTGQRPVLAVFHVCRLKAYHHDARPTALNRLCASFRRALPYAIDARPTASLPYSLIALFRRALPYAIDARLTASLPYSLIALFRRALPYAIDARLTVSLPYSLIAFFLVFASCAASAAATNEAAHYRHISAVTLPETAQGEELAQVLLTPEMFAATQDGYADIRVIHSGTGQVVPSLVECVTREQRKIRRVTETLTLTQADDTPGDQLRVLFVRPRKPAGSEEFPLRGLTVKTPLRDFERHVRVEVSDDGGAWHTIIEQARIFDVSSYADLRVTDIPLPPFTQRHIRLTFNKHDQRTDAVTNVRTSADGQGDVRSIDRAFREEQRPFRIDRVDGWCEESYWERDARPLVTREIRLTDAKPRRLPNPAAGTLMCFEAGRVPLESLTFDAPERILTIPYELFIETDLPDHPADSLKRIANGILERVAFRDYRSERMTITLPTTRADRYYLAVPDTAPKLTLAEAQGPDYRVVFPYSNGDSMTLLIGNPDALPSARHADPIKTLMRTVAEPLMAEAAPLAENPGWDGKARADINMTYLLAAVIVLTVIVLAFALITALRRLPQTDTPA